MLSLIERHTQTQRSGLVVMDDGAKWLCRRERYKGNFCLPAGWSWCEQTGSLTRAEVCGGAASLSPKMDGSDTSALTPRLCCVSAENEESFSLQFEIICAQP